MQTLDLDSTSFGGMGGGSAANNPLLWLITLAALGRNGGFLGGNGEAAGLASNSAKIDCLQQGQQSLMQQIADNGISRQFESTIAAISALSGIQRDSTSELAGIQRDSTAAITGQINDLRAQNAECCCELRAGQQAIQTAIAMQTNELNVVANANTQRILDKMCDTASAVLQQDNDRLRQQLSEQTIISALSKGNS